MKRILPLGIINMPGSGKSRPLFYPLKSRHFSCGFSTTRTKSNLKLSKFWHDTIRSKNKLSDSLEIKLRFSSYLEEEL